MQVAIAMVKSTALYVFLALPVCIWWLGVRFDDAWSAAADPSSLSDWFLWSTFGALPVLVAAVVVGAIALMFSRRLRPRGVGGLFESVLAGLAYAVVNPFVALRAPVVDKKVNDLTGVSGLMSTALAYFRFAWAVALIAYIAVGLVVVA